MLQKVLFIREGDLFYTFLEERESIFRRKYADKNNPYGFKQPEQINALWRIKKEKHENTVEHPSLPTSA